MTAYQTCARYVALFETLTPQTIAQLEPLLSEQVRFRDPFNDVCGFAAVQRLLDDMFERTRDPRFEVSHWSLDGQCGYVLWTFSAGLPVLGPWQVEGVSRLTFDDQGRISSHIDYWDAGGLYEKVPLLGRVIGLIRRRLGRVQQAA
jgi:hypothetical protein